MNKIFLLVTILFFASLISSCDSSETSSPTTNSTEGVDSVFFTVDGVDYKFKITARSTAQKDVFQFDARDTASGKMISLSFIDAKLGTFSTRNTPPTMRFNYTNSTYSHYEIHTNSFGSLTVVITELTPHFKATFHGKLDRTTGSNDGPQELTMTNGRIIAKIQ